MRSGVPELLYLIAAVCFIIGLKRLSHPGTAVSGNRISAIGMLIAIVVTLAPAHPITAPRRSRSWSASRSWRGPGSGGVVTDGGAGGRRLPVWGSASNSWISSSLCGAGTEEPAPWAVMGRVVLLGRAGLDFLGCAPKR